MRPAVGALILLFVKKVDVKHEGYISTIYSIHRQLISKATAQVEKQPVEVFSEEELFFALFCGLLILIAVAAMEVEASKIKSSKLIFSSCTRIRRAYEDGEKENVKLPKRDLSASNLSILSTSVKKPLPGLLREIDTTKAALPVLEGNISQVYKLFNAAAEVVSIFKPYNLKNNNSKGLALSSKRHCVNEVAAYKLDNLLESKFSASVPETRHVQLPYSLFSQDKDNTVVKGSLQRFLSSAEVSENFGPSLFSKEDVFNVGILDIRILNCDRHQGNLLFKTDEKKLFPIDHALSFPEIEFNLDISASPYLTGDMTDEILYLRNVSYDWLMFPQAREAFPKEYIKVIGGLNIEKQMRLMKKLGYNIKQRLACYSSLVLFKVGVLKYNKTLYDIGSLIQRQGARKKPSVLEILVDETLKKVSKRKLALEDSAESMMFMKLFNEKVGEFFRL